MADKPAEFRGYEAKFTWDAEQEGVYWGTFYGGFYGRHKLMVNSYDIRTLAIDAFREIRERSYTINLIIPHWEHFKIEAETAKFVHYFVLAFDARYKQEWAQA